MRQLQIPIFAEQSRNALMLAKHGGGIVLSKTDLGSPDKLKDSLSRILSDDRYEIHGTTIIRPGFDKCYD